MAMSIEERRKKDRDRKREKYASDEAWRTKERIRIKWEAEKRATDNKFKGMDYCGKKAGMDNGRRCHNPDCGLPNGGHDMLNLHQIDFHRRKPENYTKPFKSLFAKYSWDRIKEEIDNCDVIPLCGICHIDAHMPEYEEQCCGFHSKILWE